MLTNTTVEPIVFKPEFTPQHGWLNYGVTLVILLMVMLVLAKKHKPGNTALTGCQLIEKKHLGNKTVVYIVKYQQQRFLLADNQQALAVHPLEVTESLRPAACPRDPDAWQDPNGSREQVAGRRREVTDAPV